MYSSAMRTHPHRIQLPSWRALGRSGCAVQQQFLDGCLLRDHIPGTAVAFHANKGEISLQRCQKLAQGETNRGRQVDCVCSLTAAASAYSPRLITSPLTLPPPPPAGPVHSFARPHARYCTLSAHPADWQLRSHLLTSAIRAKALFAGGSHIPPARSRSRSLLSPTTHSLLVVAPC